MNTLIINVMRGTNNLMPAAIYKGILMLLLAGSSFIACQQLLPLADRAPGLTDLIAANVDESGVKHPLTAVLLNFRGYDTLLEIGVLLLAVIAVWSLNPDPQYRFTFLRPVNLSPLLSTALGILVPASILTAGYLVWIGAYRPGGAFQAGTLIGAVWVVLITTGMISLPLSRDRLVRLLLVAGFIFFLAAALLLGMGSGQLLRYPKPYAGTIILVIETLLSVSIGTSIGALFAAVTPQIRASGKEDTGHE